MSSMLPLQWVPFGGEFVPPTDLLCAIRAPLLVGGHGVAKFNLEQFAFFLASGLELPGVTHWFPLPLPPAPPMTVAQALDRLGDLVTEGKLGREALEVLRKALEP